MKFNAVEALINQHGYTLKDVRVGSEIVHEYLTKTYEKTEDVVWHGPTRFEMTVEVLLSRDRETLRVNYFAGSTHLKKKTHLNDKRAYNAIRDTLANHGYQI